MQKGNTTKTEGNFDQPNVDESLALAGLYEGEIEYRKGLVETITRHGNRTPKLKKTLIEEIKQYEKALLAVTAKDNVR